WGGNGDNASTTVAGCCIEHSNNYNPPATNEGWGRAFRLLVREPGLAATTVVVTPGAVTLTVGDTIGLTARAYEANRLPIPDMAFTWQTTNATVATVASSGPQSAKVTASATGTATITAAPSQGLSGVAAITVYPPAPPPPPGDRLVGGEWLASLTSSDGRFRLVYQADGNVVEYQGSTALWATYTFGPGYAVMQQDGNFVVYTPDSVPKWSTNTWGHPGAYLVMQNDGNKIGRASCREEM